MSKHSHKLMSLVAGENCTVQMRVKPGGVFWSDWSSPVTAMVPQTAGESWKECGVSDTNLYLDPWNSVISAIFPISLLLFNYSSLDLMKCRIVSSFSINTTSVTAHCVAIVRKLSRKITFWGSVPQEDKVMLPQSLFMLKVFKVRTHY